eukprot:CAMPEP_0197660398 /NCGR_PEP_ID=MMETSP1338-20131121/50821_1 /TAXON_ID=43686 ORGANISM="Pelagodinium beii, Strain RCC1491" /NCGR_SAMPLE_ID=MMETSP1338 /ASSEMBLY_ACC=CAM_ASM_000754 /LENGTH=48 /DNA_ID= /DNA_START= /DNA_END= /DNA_ORIENTATION=
MTGRSMWGCGYRMTTQASSSSSSSSNSACVKTGSATTGKYLGPPDANL